MTTATASRSRFGYHQAGSAPTLMKSSTSSPDLLLKSASRDIHLLQSSSYKDRSSELDDAETTSAALSRSFEFGLDPNFWNEHNVQVIIRVRPLSGSELSIQGDTRCVRQESTQAITWTGHPESRFTFDIMADENVSQEILFKVSGVPMVENCMEGYNSCMFAYGQGKEKKIELHVYRLGNLTLAQISCLLLFGKEKKLAEGPENPT